MNAVLEADATTTQYLSFRVRDTRYGLPIDGVREIIEYGRVTGVPMMPAFIHGVINLRGSVVPVLDLAARFGLSRSVAGRRTCIVIIELSLQGIDQRIGLVVDAVDAVLDIEASEIEPAPAFGVGIRTEFIAGMARDERGFTIVLDVPRILSLEDILHLIQAGQAGG